MSHTVTIQPSGHRIVVETGESVLEAGLREGFALPYGCRNGACGSCAGKLLAGRVHYPDGKPAAISEDEIAQGKALLCQARPDSDLEVEIREVGAAKDIQVKVLPCRVAAMDKLSHDVMRLKLKLPATERLQFLAGQYIDIILRDGRRRGFSLATAPHEDDFLELHIRHVPGGRFTDYVFTDMKEKAILRFEGPLGSFFLREESDRPIILMGGGTGFAPLRGMTEHAIAAGLQRPIEIYWGVRAKRDLYLHDLAEAWAREHENIRYVPVLSEPAEEDEWSGRTGFVHQAVTEDHPDLSGHEVYMSGPPAMIEAARTAFASCGLPDEFLFYDSFEYASDTLQALDGN